MHAIITALTFFPLKKSNTISAATDSTAANISLTLSGSLAFNYGWQESALNLLFAGAILFTASDLVLSGTYFGTGHERPIDFVLNYFTYYPAQFLIATALMFV